MVLIDTDLPDQYWISMDQLEISKALNPLNTQQNTQKHNQILPTRQKTAQKKIT